MIEKARFVNSDLTNLVRSTHAVALLVNARMQVKMMTPQAQTLFDLDQKDHHFMVQQIESTLKYTTLKEDLCHVQNSQKMLERDVRAHDGRYFLMRLQPYTTRAGRAVGTMMTLSDVTALRVTEQRLRTSERQARLAVQMPQVAIITIDDLGHITAWNSGAAAVFQWQEHEMLGVSLAKIFIDEESARSQLHLDLDAARSSRLLENQGLLKRKDLSVFHAIGILTPLGMEPRHGFVAVVHDVSNQRLVAASLERIVAQEQEIRQKVQAANRLKDEFLAVMSHELKHPLNLIHVSAELLSRHPDAASSPVIANAAEAICDAVRSQSKIIDDLLDLSRIRTGKLALKTTLQPIDRTVGAVVAAAHDGAQKVGVTLTLKTLEAPIMVECDRVRVEQITWNLISNALKFTPAGGSVHVALRRDPSTMSVILDVSDTGRGIDANHLHYIFEMFHQGSSDVDRNESGLGIGLALVRELVHAHRGQIRAASLGRDKGSTFTVSLPGLRNIEAGIEDFAPMQAVNPLSGLRLLLVDDSRKTTEMFAAVLRLEGCTVDTAYAGAEALSCLALNDYDLLISDLSMPKMSGFELIAFVRASTRNNSLLAIALSGFSQPSEIARALDAGFDGHLPKPSGVAKIKSAVLRLQNHRDADLKHGQVEPRYGA